MSDDIKFTFNGVLSDAFFLVQNVERSIFPEINNRSVSVPGRNAPYDFGAEFTERKFPIDVVMYSDSLENFRSKVRDIADWLNPLNGAKPLVFSDEPNMTYNAKLVNSTDIEQIVISGKGTLIFECMNRLTAEGAELTQTIAGMTTEEKDIDTQAEFNAGTLTDVVASVDGLKLTKEGSDYNPVISTFTGTHSQTATNSNGNLVLGGTTSAASDPYTFNYSSGSFVSTVNDNVTPGTLRFFGLAAWSTVDNMSVYSPSTWIQYQETDNTGDVTFTQGAGYLQMVARGEDGAIRRDFTDAFPWTIDFIYQLNAPSSPNGNPVVVEARVFHQPTNRQYRLNLPTTGVGVWKICRIVATATTSDFYVDGVRIGSGVVSAPAFSTTRVQFFVANTQQCDFRLSYFSKVNAVLTTAGSATYPLPTTGTYNSLEVNLDGNNNDIYTSSTVTYTATTPTGDEGKNSSATVEIDVFKSGAWQGYQTVATGGALPHLSSGNTLTGVKIRVRVTLRTYITSTGYPPTVGTISINVSGLDEVYFTSGSFTTAANTAIQAVGTASSSYITWADTLPALTSTACSVSVENVGSPAVWQTVTKGSSIPQITPSTDLTNKELKVKFDLSTTDNEVTPLVTNYNIQLVSNYHSTGARVGNEYLDLSLLPDIGQSLITWDGTPDGSPDIEVYVNITDQTTPTGAWVQATNGEPIPGITPGDNTLLNKRVFARQVINSPSKSSTPTLNRLLFYVQAEGGGTIAYNGTDDSFPLITVEFLENIDFETQPFSILHQQTGNKLLFNRNFTAGIDEIVVDCSKRSVLINGVNAAEYLSIESDYFYFVKGVNDFVVTPESSANVTFDWKERFI